MIKTVRWEVWSVFITENFTTILRAVYATMLMVMKLKLNGGEWKKIKLREITRPKLANEDFDPSHRILKIRMEAEKNNIVEIEE